MLASSWWMVARWTALAAQPAHFAFCFGSVAIPTPRCSGSWTITFAQSSSPARRHLAANWTKTDTPSFEYRDYESRPHSGGEKIVESGNGFTFDFINSPVNLFNGKGGTFTLADDSDYPGGIGSGMASVVLVLAPCAMIQPHYQPRVNEIGYLISGGPMRWATQFEAGEPLVYEFLQVGQALMLPKGSMHYGLVLGCDPTLVGRFRGFDDETIAASEGTYGVQPVDFSQLPQPLNLGAQQCLDRGGIDRSAFDVGQTTKLHAKRVLAGNLSTFEPLPDLDLTQTTRTNQAPYSNYAVLDPSQELPPSETSPESTASGSGNKVQGSVSDPMANNVNHVDPSAWNDRSDRHRRVLRQRRPTLAPAPSLASHSTVGAEETLRN
ncbi:hypothetical protein BT69DRAFT_1338760 [Atractiella rhizophila]|nr:hypothetical protein BT69DRAFT_1338760 [Atractiella rhizophila]